jgi:hypothetical protein
VSKQLLIFTIIGFFFTTIWGHLGEYSDHYAVVDGKKYPYAQKVTIDTYSLYKSPRGDVRVELDASGRATEVFFYGIDMPQAVRYYKVK